MNPRYLAYCAAHGNTPEQQMAADVAAYPGGKMCGFMLWICRKWQEFAEAHGCKVSYWLRIWDHNEFDMWLSSK